VIGSALPTISKKFRLEDFKRGDEKTIHTDYEAAAREGLPAPVAVGPQVAALVFRQMRLCFGEGWIVGGKFDLSFRRPVFVTDFCVARGVVTKTEKEGDKLRVHCDVWIENQKSDKVISGMTSGLVPLASGGA
ncbi:MAG: MaoC family dehydratase, partial [Betaproteobacteria bacterium]|nr:MaoC family dehydratase [Betaproteobacteria bacterium]